MGFPCKWEKCRKDSEGKKNSGVRPGGRMFAWGVFSLLRFFGVSPPSDEPLLFRQKDPKPCWPWHGRAVPPGQGNLEGR